MNNKFFTMLRKIQFNLENKNHSYKTKREHKVINSLPFLIRSLTLKLQIINIKDLISYQLKALGAEEYEI